MDRTITTDTIIPDTSDRSTESESISPSKTSRKKANSQLEKLRVGVQVTLFSRGKSSSLCDFGRNSSPTTTIGDISSPESPEVKSHQRLETVRRISEAQNTRESPFPSFLSPKKPTPHKMSASSQDEFGQLEKSLEMSVRLPSGSSIVDEGLFEAAEKMEENTLKLHFDQSIEEEKSGKKMIVQDGKSVVHEEVDGELSDEDTKRIKHPVFLMDKEREIEELKEELKVSEDKKIHFIPGNFDCYYTQEEILGEGASGVVKKCLKIGTDEYYAVKAVHYKNDDEILVLIIKEFQNHSKLNHRNIIKAYELYIDYFQRKIYTVMELADCNEMFEVIKNLGHYSEAIASGIFKQILAGIHYLHTNGVCHRDIKPNNILVSKDGQVVKITDFNVSKFLDKKSHRYSPLSTANYKMWTHTGTIAFTAPEVFEGTEYTEAIDMWSAGTVLYTMLCGYQPFQADYVQDLIELIKEAKYEFHPESWDTISLEAKQLIRRCLDPDYKTRWSPSDALMCPWITNRGKVPDTTINMIKSHNRMRSIYETNSSNTSCKATPDISSTALAKAVSDVTVKRRSSEAISQDSANFRKLKNYLNKTQKKLSKFSPSFRQEMNEASPSEEASPQLKKAKSKNFGDKVRALQIQNLLEAAEETPVGNFGVSYVPIDEEIKENIQEPVNMNNQLMKNDNNYDRLMMIKKVDMMD